MKVALPPNRPYDLLTLGEAMVRLSPPGMLRVGQTSTLEIQIGGAEWNVACNTARLGVRSGWLSRLTRNPLGELIADTARAHGVDVSHVAWTNDDRVGLYFVEFGRPPRPTNVIYDRAASAASRMSSADFAPELWQQTRLLHLSGITPALGPSCQALCADAIRCARASGALAIFDVNYRAKLWSPEAARATLTPLIRACSLVLCGRADAELIFGARGEPEAITASLQQQFGLPVVVTLGADGSCARDAAGQFVLVAHPPTTEVDRVGAGDAFASGLIYGLLKHNDLAQALPFGGALAALKLTVHGDVAWIGPSELEALVGGGNTATIKR